VLSIHIDFQDTGAVREKHAHERKIEALSYGLIWEAERLHKHDLLTCNSMSHYAFMKVLAIGENVIVVHAKRRHLSCMKSKFTN